MGKPLSNIGEVKVDIQKQAIQRKHVDYESGNVKPQEISK